MRPSVYSSQLKEFGGEHESDNESNNEESRSLMHCIGQQEVYLGTAC
jgi:hypothetical protein